MRLLNFAADGVVGQFGGMCYFGIGSLGEIYVVWDLVWLPVSQGGKDSFTVIHGGYDCEYSITSTSNV